VAKTVWNGAISFGLVSVPVKAYTAVREHTVHFHQLEKGTGARIRYRKVSEKTNREVATDDIESGYEVSRGSYVIVDPDEIEDLRVPSTKSVDIADFVRLDDVDPVYYAHTYWLAPDGQAAERPYRLLLAAMNEEQQVGIGRVVMRNKQYLAAIRPLGKALALSTMHFADEIVDPGDVEGVPVAASKAKPKAEELALAGRIIKSMSTDWRPDRYHDDYTEQLRDLIERKAKGETITPQPEPEPSAEILNLTQALEASLAATRGKQPARKPPKKAAGKGTARKASAGGRTAPASRGQTRPRRSARKSA
jgi:DNA end-binding protein Ku